MPLDALVPLVGGLLISIVFEKQLTAAGEWMGERIGEIIIFLIFGRLT